MSHEINQGRRRILRKAAASAVAVPLTGLFGARVSAAQADRLDPSSSQAQAQNYVHDASNAGPARTEGAICGNCVHWTGGDSQWGGCNIFPQSLVNRAGWCSVWVEG